MRTPVCQVPVKGLVPVQGPDHFMALERERTVLKSGIRSGRGNTLEGPPGYVVGTYVPSGKNFGNHRGSRTAFRVYQSRGITDSMAGEHERRGVSSERGQHPPAQTPNPDQQSQLGENLQATETLREILQEFHRDKGEDVTQARWRPSGFQLDESAPGAPTGRRTAMLPARCASTATHRETSALECESGAWSPLAKAHEALPGKIEGICGNEFGDISWPESLEATIKNLAAMNLGAESPSRRER